MSRVEAGFTYPYGKPLGYIDHTGGPSQVEVESSRWHQFGACVDMPTRAWFANTKSRMHGYAVQVCEDCPVRRLCLASALVHGDQYGVWGGLPDGERAPLAARLRRGETLGAVLADALGPDNPAARVDGAA